MAVLAHTPPLPVATEPKLLTHARRLDWRFLLPSHRLGRVAYLGEADTSLLEALETFAEHVARPAEGASGTYDLVVLRNPHAALLDRAHRLVRPGGSIYVELDRSALWGLAGLRRPRRIRRILSGLGFEAIQLSWHQPDFRRCGQIFPLGASEIVHRALGERTLKTTLRVRAWRDRLLLRLGLLPALAPAVSIVATRADARGPRTNAVEKMVAGLVQPAELGRRRLAGGAHTHLITPRFRTSRHVVALLFPAGESTPTLVAKVPRLAGDNGGVANEALILAEFDARGAPEDSIPRVAAFGDAGDRAVLVQTAVIGSPLTPALIRSDPRRHVEAMLAWLGEVERATGAEDGYAAWQTLVALPLEAFAAASPRDGEERRLVARTLELTAPIAECGVRVGVQHGDLSHPNLMALDGGGIGVVDWELAELHGLPLQDASYFLGYAAFSLAGARGVAEELAAFDEAFIAPGGWAARELGAFAKRTGIPGGLVTPLFVAGWARSAARMRDRLEPGSAGDPSAWLRESRYYVLWRHALEHASQLQWEA